MTCGIDRIREEAKETLQRVETELVEDLLVDFDLEADAEAILQSPQMEELHGALETFTVWLAHGRLLKK